MSDKVDFNWGSSTDVVSVEGASFNRDSELSISSVENLSMFDRSLDVVVKNEEFGLRGVITVKQERPALSYAPAVTWEGSHVVSAAGASVRPVITVTATKQGTTTVVGEEVLVPDSISTGAEWVSQEGDVFVVASRGTEEGVSRSALVHYAGVLSNGDSIEGSFLITQEANTYSVEHAGGVLTYGPVVAGEISSELVPAGGGEAVATVGDGSQTWTRSAEVINHVYTSGAVEEVEVVTPAESGSISVAPEQRTFTYTFTSRGTQVSANQKFYYFPEDAQWIGEDGQSASVHVVVYQQENLRTGPRYTDITGTYSYPQAPAGGGSIVGKTSFKQYQVYDYTSGATSQSTPSGKPSITYAKISGDGTLVSTTGNTVEVPSRGTTVDTEDTVAYTGTVTISWHGVTVVWTASIIQEANIKTETLRIWGGGVNDGGLNRPESWGRISAGPGSEYLRMQGSWTTAYTSGVEDTVAIDPFEDLPEGFTPTVSSDATSWAVPKGIGGGGSGPYVRVMPRGTEEGAERSGSVTWELNGVTSNALTFTQEANVKTQTGITISKGDAAGGWASKESWGDLGAASAALWIDGVRDYSFTSGATTAEGISKDGLPESFSSTISGDATEWAHSYAPSGATVRRFGVYVGSRGTNIGPARTGSVTWELDGFTSNALTFTQVQNEVVSLTGVSAGFSYVSSVAAVGGSVSPVFSGQETYVFTSGSTASDVSGSSPFGGSLSVTRIFSMPATAGWSLNNSTGVLTATNNTSLTARTSGVVTCERTLTFTNPASVGGTVVSGSGESTATASQLAGSYSYAAWVVSASANPTSIGAGGGVSTITGSASRTYGWNGATSGAGTETGTVAYSIPTTSGATLSDNKLTWASRGTTVGDARSVTVTVTCQEDTTKTATVVVSQVANEATTITYGVPSVTVSASDVPASGGSVTSGTATYSQSRTQNYTSGSTSVLSALTSGGTVTWSGGASNVASLGATEKARTAVGSPLTATVTMNGQSGTGSVTVYQAANSATTITYGDITGTFTYSSVGAGGGTSTPTVSYSQPRTQNYTSGGTSALSAVTSGATLTYAKTSGGGTLSSASTGSVSVASRGTTVDSANTTAYTGTVTIALNGKSKSLTASVTQTRNEATGITYGTPTVSLSYGTVPAGGGTVSPTLSYTQSRTQNYTSGSTSALSAVTSGGSVSYSRTSGSATVDASTGAVTGASRGTTVDSADTTAAVVKATVTLNSKSGEASATVSQVRNQATSITYGTPSVTVTASDVPAGGGSVTSGTATYSQSRTQNYTSGSTSVLSAVTTGGSVAWSGGASNIASLGTTVKARTAVGSALTATVTLNSKSGTGSATVYQAANSATYGALTGGAVSASDIPASGATRTATVTNMTQTVSFTSGSSRAGTVSNSQTTAVTGSSLGTTIKARTKLGSITVTFTGEGSKTDTKSVDVYQAENKVTAIGSVTAAFSYGSAVAAAGGSVSPTLAGGCTLVFSSGAETLANISGAHYGGSLSFSRGSYTMPTTTGWSVNATSGTLTATNNTSTSARTSGAVSNTITATYTNPSTVGSTVVSKDDTKTATASQSAGYYTYSDITASMSYPATAAAGGTSTPTISFSQTYGWNGSTSGAGTVTSYSKGSFSMSASTGATLNTSTGVITWANNTSTSSRTSASVSVTLTGSGSKTKTISATATQNAGYYTYSDVTASMSYSAAAAGGATVTPTISFSQTYGWNGATSGAGTVSTYTKGTFSMTATTGATLNTSTGAVTWANNTSSSARTSNAVSVRITGSGSKYKDISATSSQNAGSYSYAAWTVALSANTTSIGAGGGAATLTSSASRTYGWNGATSGAGTQAGTIKLSIPTTTGATLSGTTSGSTLTWASFGTTISNSRSVVVTATCQENTGVTQTVTITQSGNYVTAVTTTGSLSYSAIGAGGGTGSATAGGSPTFTFSSGSTSTTTPSTTYGSLSTTNAFSWSAASGNFTALNTSTGAVTVSSKGTTISNATSSPTVTLTRTVTWTPTTSYNSAGTKTGSKTATATCSQNGNYVSSLTASTGGSFSYASTHGGTVTPSASNRTLTYTFTSGSTSTTTPASTYGSLTTGSASYSWPGASGAFTALNASTGAMTVSSAGASAVSASTSPTVTRSMTYTWTPASSYNAGGTKTVTPTQTATCTRLANSLTWNDPVITFTYGDISAGGSTVTPTVSITQSGSYTNGSTTSNTIIGSKSFSGTSVNTSTGAVSGSSLGTTVKARTKITTATVSVTANLKTATKTADVYQAANSATYGALSGGSVSAADIPASGGTRTATVTNMSQTVSFTSGSSRAGSVSNSQTAAVSGSSLGTTVKARTKLGSITVTFTGEGSKTDTKSVDVYQEANAVTNANYNPRITARGIPTVSIGSGITAGGGSATVTASVNDTQTYNALYTSGSTGSDQTRSVTGTVSLSLTANGNSRFSLSGTTLSHSSMTTNVTTDSATVTATNSNDSSKKNTASVSVQNTQSVSGTTGGAYTYYDVTAGAITNATIAASGGTKTATAGNGSQRVTRTAIVTSYSYTSGSTSSATTTAASDVTNSISPSVASKSGTASSKGTTVSGVTTVASQAVTWSGQGSKSASGTMYVYQEANSLTWNNPVVTMSYGDVPAGGGTVTPTVSITQSGSYTSGSTASNTTIDNKSFSGTGVNTSTGAYTGSSLGTTVKSRTKLSTGSVSVTAKSKTGTGSADIYQAANAIASYKDWSDTFTLNPNIVSAGGDKVYFSGSSKGTAVYTSGSSGTAGAITSNLTGVTSGATWATVNFADGSISVSGNSGSTGRNTTITGTYANGRTKTATLTQEANIGSMYVVFHNNTAQTINWQVAFTLTLNGNYVSAYGSSAYETTMYGQQSESLSPVGEINPAAAGMTTCSQIKLTDVTVGAFRENGASYSSQFRAWVTVEMHNASNGGDLQLSTCGTNSSPMITNGTTNTSPTSSSNVSCSPTFYTAEANRYLIHIAIG